MQRNAPSDDDEAAQPAAPSFLTARELQVRAPTKAPLRNEVSEAQDEDEDEEDKKRKPGGKPAPR